MLFSERYGHRPCRIIGPIVITWCRWEERKQKFEENTIKAGDKITKMYFDGLVYHGAMIKKGNEYILTQRGRNYFRSISPGRDLYGKSKITDPKFTEANKILNHEMRKAIDDIGNDVVELPDTVTITGREYRGLCSASRANREIFKKYGDVLADGHYKSIIAERDALINNNNIIIAALSDTGLTDLAKLIVIRNILDPAKISKQDLQWAMSKLETIKGDS